MAICEFLMFELRQREFSGQIKILYLYVCACVCVKMPVPLTFAKLSAHAAYSN